MIELLGSIELLQGRDSGINSFPNSCVSDHFQLWGNSPNEVCLGVSCHRKSYSEVLLLLNHG